MKCPRCEGDKFKVVPYIDKDIKGFMYICFCNHRMYEVEPKDEKNQRLLAEAFEKKKQELSRE